MKRILVTQIGEPSESLVVQEVEDLQPKAGEVLVEMLAIPIHPADLLVMRGRHVFTANYPCGTGIEGAAVVAHGPGVDHPPIGQRVACPSNCIWAEQVTLPAASVIPLPDHVDLHQGAMLALKTALACGNETRSMAAVQRRRTPGPFDHPSRCRQGRVVQHGAGMKR